MESTLFSVSSSTMSVMSIHKFPSSHSSPLIAHVHPRFSTTRPSQLAQLQLKRSVRPGFLMCRLGSVDLHRSQWKFAGSFSVPFASGGGGSFGNARGGGSGGGGGDGGTESGDNKPSAVSSGATDAATLGSDAIILEVGGMTCGGCAASVKRILESQPQVSSANVDLTTETATVWSVSEVKDAPNWQKDIGEALAKHLTNCGFKSALRDQGAVNEDS